MEKEVWLQNLTWEDVKQKAIESQGTIILPIGSTEQHGAHLPVGTDTMVANAIAEAAALKADILVAPPLWFGWSPHHLVLPGTITIRAEVLIEVAFDMIKSLSRHHFDKFILLNGHRIVNVAWMQIAAERAKRELGVKVIIFDPAYMSKEFTGDMQWGEVGHAEEIEGSHMWHCYPDLVKMDRAQDNPHQHDPIYHVDPRYAGDTLCYVPSSPAEMQRLAEKSGGTSGASTKASQKLGEQYHAHLVDRMLEAIAFLQKPS
ncbi:MAG: creatininase family protein [Desulfobacterales bacterium]